MQRNNPLSTVWSPRAQHRRGKKTLIQTFQISGNDLPCCFHYCTDHTKTADEPTSQLAALVHRPIPALDSVARSPKINDERFRLRR
jgi:hypothetical protein